MLYFCFKVNIVPIIAKADSLTAEECQRFKQQVLVLALLAEIRQEKIKNSLACIGQTLLKQLVILILFLDFK